MVMLVVVMLVAVVVSVFIGPIMPVLVLAPGLVRVGTLDRPAFEKHTKPGAGQAATGRLAALHRNPGQAEACDRVDEDIQGHAQIQTGPEKHVSGEAARAVEVIVRHGREGYHAV